MTTKMRRGLLDQKDSASHQKDQHPSFTPVAASCSPRIQTSTQ